MTAREKILPLLEEKGADCALFLDEVSIRWLTRFAASDGAAVVDRTGVRLLVDPRYYAAARDAKAAGRLFDDVCPEPFSGGLLAALASLSGRRVLLDSARVTVRTAERLRGPVGGGELLFCDDVCGLARRVKDAFELDCIRRAQAVTDAAFAHILASCARLTETQVAAELEYFCRRSARTAWRLRPSPSREQSAYPHGVPGDVRCERVLTRISARAWRHCSDMTRTVVLGRATPEMKRIYDTVLTAQEKAIAAVRGGVPCSAVDAAARTHIDACGYAGLFGHSTGHSLGLEIHERPAFSAACADPAAPGTVMTVEPGVYVEGLGGVRIEDMVLVTEMGCENLTRSPKQLIEL
ncbi:MAG: M24 family metallopeptidase [Acutalibacteraceae bacterium]